MKQEAIEKGARIDIPYFEGVNGSVSHVLAKKTELAHAENARSLTIGTIEKRRGQSVVGTQNDTGSTPFFATGNYALAHFENSSGHSLYRVSTENPEIELQIDVNDDLNVVEIINNTTLVIFVRDVVSIGEAVMDNVPNMASTYYYDENANSWNALSGDDIPAAKFSHTIADGNLFLVNGYSANRYVDSTGVAEITSASGSGHLYNSPNAKKVAFYKNRLYLANFKKDFTWYPTTVLRSSYPLGIVALVAEDLSAVVSTTSSIKVTDNKYFYADSGANEYEIWRGGTKILNMTIDLINEYTIHVLSARHPVSNATDNTISILASDEVWIAGTYTGKKIFRWVSNPTTSGKDVKLYDTFTLSGGDNDEINMMATIGDVLMMGNNNSLSTWNDYTLQTHDVGVGCVSKSGYVKSYGSLYFLHYTGIYSTSGGIPTLISQKVRRYIEGATKSGLENAAAGKKGKSIFFTIGEVTLYAPDGSIDKVLHNTCLEYSIPETNWYVHTNVTGDEFETHRTENNLDALMMTGTTGMKSVKQFLDPTMSTDEGVEIPFRADINDTALQPAFENISHPYGLLVEADRGTSMRAFVKIDREQYYELNGVINKGVSTLKVHNRDDKRGQPPPARMLSVSIRDNSKQICKLNRLSILHIPTLADGDPKQ